MWRRLPPLAFWIVALALAWGVWGEQRFPPPEFESGYVLPGTPTPAPRAAFLAWVDVLALAAGLGLAAWLSLKRRSRRGLVWLSLASLLYFGFYREGCICAIGSVQNVALGLFDPTYPVPWAVTAFFALPLAFSLFTGRSFCAAVCPHGALQDLVLLKPVKVPAWLDHGLSVVPFLFLGAGVAFAATGSAFVICRYDPFVPLFRMTGSVALLLAGGAFVLLGLFVGRPYCRFLCPYGALLRLGATVSKWRVRITPDFCTQCRLCEHSCPFGAIREPESAPAHPRRLAADRRRLGGLLALLPVLVLAGGWLGSRLSVPASKLHPAVRLAEHYLAHRGAALEFGPQTPEALEFKRAEEHPKAALAAAGEVRQRFRVSGWAFGLWSGLVLGVKLLSLSLHRTRTDFEPDRGACVSCARCFTYCPNERVRIGLVPIGPPAPPAATSLPHR